MKSVVMGLLATVVFSNAYASPLVMCTLDASKKVTISVGVDEAYGANETVLMGINPHGDNSIEDKIRSAVLPNGSMKEQLSQGYLIIALGSDAKDTDTEVFDSTLFAIRKVKNSNKYKGYISLYDDGVAAMSVTCEEK